MPLIINKNKDIKYNLALEEYLLRDYNLKDDVLLIWYGQKAFVFGRNQNPFIEIHHKYLLDSSIPKLRRVSGGGTIFEDKGTINFSYITKAYKNKINNYEFFLKPVVELLKEFNLNAYFKPKSHLFVDKVKISGNAQAFINNRLMHHGTILFNTNLDIIEEALVNYRLSASGHHILSNKQPVANLNEFINVEKEEFVKLLVDKICQYKNITKDQLKIKDNIKIAKLIKDKYSSWEWNFAKSPNFNITVNIDSFMIDLEVEKGLIKKVSDDKYKLLKNKKLFSEEYYNVIKQK
ncbi:MAG: lipoate--protein ligase family protein [Bacillota bacterium]